MKIKGAVLLTKLKAHKPNRELPLLMFYKPINNTNLNYWHISFERDIKIKNNTATIFMNVMTDNFKGLMKI